MVASLNNKLMGKKKIVRFHSSFWIQTQQKYSTIKKKFHQLFYVFQKFKEDLLNKEFSIHVDCKSSKDIVVR